jgi:hypothetical protein
MTWKMVRLGLGLASVAIGAGAIAFAGEQSLVDHWLGSNLPAGRANADPSGLALGYTYGLIAVTIGIVVLLTCQRRSG